VLTLCARRFVAQPFLHHIFPFFGELPVVKSYNHQLPHSEVVFITVTVPLPMFYTLLSAPTLLTESFQIWHHFQSRATSPLSHIHTSTHQGLFCSNKFTKWHHCGSQQWLWSDDRPIQLFPHSSRPISSMWGTSVMQQKTSEEFFLMSGNSLTSNLGLQLMEVGKHWINQFI
jgi:hypothetical protein